MTEPSTLSAACPKCGHELWSRRRGEWTLQNRILKLTAGGLAAKCPDCGADVPVPFLTISTPTGAPRRLVVKVPR